MNPTAVIALIETSVTEGILDFSWTLAKKLLLTINSVAFPINRNLRAAGLTFFKKSKHPCSSGLHFRPAH